MNKKYYVSIILENDEKINLCLDTKYAPKTVENFIHLVKEKYYDGTIFHRIIKDFMIQAGGYCVNDNMIRYLKETKSIVGEFKSNGYDNSLKHDLGVISMARTNDKNSASSQFFLCVNNCSHLDQNYAAFGKTIDEESNKIILRLSNTKTTRFYHFDDFPVEIIKIKTIVINNIEE